MTSKDPSTAQPLEQWVKLIGGPRDGTEFESWGCGKLIEVSGYRLDKFDDRHGIVCLEWLHIYRREGVQLRNRGERRVLYMEYVHDAVKMREVSGADPK